MNPIIKIVCLSSMMIVATAGRAEANSAPSALPSCIIRYSFTSASYSTGRVVLYDASGTYTELSVTGTTLPSTGLENSYGATTSAPHHGLYTYFVDAQNPEHASIVYDGGGTGTLPTDELYFLTSSSGSKQPRASVSIGADLFLIFTMQSSTGAINLSNRTTLGVGGSTITGFVIGGTRPTWVLLRAVGLTLKSLGVPSPVSGPSFTLYDSKQNIVATSSVWSADPNLVNGYKTVFSLVGAFPLTDGSDEAVLLLPVNPGPYTAVFKTNSGGEVLCETYFLPF